MNRYVTYILIIILLYSCQNNTEKEASVITADLAQMKLDSIEKAAIHIPKFDYDTTRWFDIADLDPSIVIDMRYATADNFVEEKMYECGRCFLRPEAAKEIVKIHQRLQTKGLGLKMFDCYRPKPIQQKLWDKVPDARFVTPPAKGSQHNRGLAVDLTIVDENGKQLNMGTKYDYFGKEGYHTYKDFEDKSILENRTLLLETMADFNFRHIRTEWWHYSYRGKVKHRSISSMLWDCEDNL